MKPFVHAINSVRRYGGVPEDYLKIHDWFDSTKIAYADIRHRAILHNTFGIYLAEQLFGTYIVNSDGKKVQVRSIGEDHVAEDCGGMIPTLEDWLKHIPFDNIPNRMKGYRQKKYAEENNLTTVAD